MAAKLNNTLILYLQGKKTWHQGTKYTKFFFSIRIGNHMISSAIWKK